MKNNPESIGDILKRKYGEDYFVKLASVAGKARNPSKGFGTTSTRPEASEWFKAGGRNSKRGLAAKWPRITLDDERIVVAKTVRGKVIYFTEDGIKCDPQPELNAV